MVSKVVQVFCLVVLMSFVCEGRVGESLAPPRPPLENWAVEKRGMCPEGGGDKESSCPYWKKLKFCEPSKGYADFMKKTCPASCEICQARPTAPPKPRPGKVDIKECLKAHNVKRRLHGARPLSWDSSLASKAQIWANHLAKINKMKHAPWTGAGENLYTARNTGGKVATCKKAVEAWYGEVAHYPFMEPPNTIFDTDSQIGHFTQVVWKSTKKVGVGITVIKRGFWTITYIVARYTPPGNYQGEFKQEVGNNILALK